MSIFSPHPPTHGKTPTLVASSNNQTVEDGQNAGLATVFEPVPGDALSITQTGGLGTVSLILDINGQHAVLYTAPPGGSGTDTVTYTVQDQFGNATATQTASVILDPGPAVASLASAAVESGQTTEIAIVTPGLAGDTLSLLFADPGLTLGAVQQDGTQGLFYTAPAGTTTSTSPTLNYTVVDQHFGGGSYSQLVQTDGGPQLTQLAPAINPENGQVVVIGSVTPGLAGDVLTLTQTAGAAGVVSLGAADPVTGAQQVLYTAPLGIVLAATDAVSYSIADQHNVTTASGSANLMLDPGALVTSTTTGVLTIGQSAVVETLVAGLPGDQLSVTQAAPGYGTYSLVETFDGGGVQANTYNLVYKQTLDVASSRRDYTQVTITDRANADQLTFTPIVRLDAGARFISNVANAKIAPGATVAIGVVSPGLTFDTLAIAATNGTPGIFSLGAVSGSGTQTIFYTATSPIPADAPLGLSYVITDQTGVHPLSGTASVSIVNPLPVISAVSPVTINSTQTTIIATVRPGTATDTLTLTATGPLTHGSLSLQTINGVQDVIYTAASSIASSGSEAVAYSIGDGHGGLVTGKANVRLDSGPRLLGTTPGTVVHDQSTIVGRVLPGISTDVETLTQTGGIGTVALVNGNVIYTAASTITASGTDTVTYTVNDQSHGTPASGSASVKVLGAQLSGRNAPINSTTANAFIDQASGSPTLTFHGALSTVLVEGSASPTINDLSNGLTVAIGSASGTTLINGFASDSRGVIDLLYGTGGFTTAAAVKSALTSDNHGGSLLSLGSGSIDIANVAPTALAVSHFKIG